MLEKRLGLRRSSQQVENPAVSVQVCDIVRLRIHRLPAHCQCLLELFAVFGQEPGVVVERRRIVRILLQQGVIGLERTLVVTELVLHIPDCAPA